MAESKRFYWIKLKADFFDLAAIDYLQGQKNGCEYIVLYQKLCLITANNGGRLMTEIGEMMIPFDANKIARDTKFSIDTVVVALELFKMLGLVYEQQDGVLKIPYVDEIVGSETEWAEKMRQKRKQKKDTLSGTLYPTLYDTMSDKSIEIRDKSKEIKSKDTEKDNTLGKNAERIVALFNEICPSLQKVIKVSDARKKAIATITKAFSDEEIKTVFEKSEKSDFLTGKTKSGFKAAFDWIMKQSNFIKVLEGNYDNRQETAIQTVDQPSFNVTEIEQKKLAKYKQLGRPVPSYNAEEIEQESYEMYKN